jgi:hypothetical protein
MSDEPILNSDLLGDTINFGSAQIQDAQTVKQTRAKIETGLTLSIDKNGDMSYATTIDQNGEVMPAI